MSDKELTGLELLRHPFEERYIGKLPKPTKAQTQEVKDDYKVGIRCKICSQWHHPKVVHLDYVGHAALTDRLLDCDPEWNWEPMTLLKDGLPAFSKDGLWIKLTVCGVTRLGFGDSGGKTGGNAIKEIIGDALRNAAMRFGAALDLWHKGDLHIDEEHEVTQPVQSSMWKGPMNTTTLKQVLRDLSKEINKITSRDTVAFMEGLWNDNDAALEQAIIDLPEWYDGAVKAKRKAMKLIDVADDPFRLPETDEVGP